MKTGMINLTSSLTGSAKLCKIFKNLGALSNSSHQHDSTHIPAPQRQNNKQKHGPAALKIACQTSYYPIFVFQPAWPRQIRASQPAARIFPEFLKRSTGKKTTRATGFWQNTNRSALISKIRLKGGGGSGRHLFLVLV
jgi:hypothetical protein